MTKLRTLASTGMPERATRISRPGSQAISPASGQDKVATIARRLALDALGEDVGGFLKRARIAGWIPN
jgi:hypothetical protein